MPAVVLVNTRNYRGVPYTAVHRLSPSPAGDCLAVLERAQMHKPLPSATVDTPVCVIMQIRRIKYFGLFVRHGSPLFPSVPFSSTMTTTTMAVRFDRRNFYSPPLLPSLCSCALCNTLVITTLREYNGEPVRRRRKRRNLMYGHFRF